VNSNQRPYAALSSQFEKSSAVPASAPMLALFHSLRKSRATELLDHFPILNVCQWICNDEATARKHNLQTTDEHL
jgi:hypothetical protein